MINLNALPELVLLKIFCLVLPSESKYIAVWKQGFELLAVCHQSRCAAKHLVYGDAIIEQNSIMPCFKRTDAQNGLVTNFDLIIANHKQIFIKRLTIILCAYDFVSALRHINVQVGSAFPAGLSGTTAVSLITFPSSKQIRVKYESDRPIKRYPTYIARFARLLPNIMHIDINPGPRTQSVTFVVELVRTYVDQLRSLRLQNSLDLTIPRFGLNFQSLVIVGCHSKHRRLPLIPAQSIQTLSLKNLFYDFTWQTCFYGFDSNVLSFPKLRQLILGLSSRQISRRTAGLQQLKSMPLPYYVLFPALQHLEIGPYVHTAELFGNAKINSNLEQLHVNGSFSTLCGLRNAGIFSIDRLEVDIRDNSISDSQILADTLNYFFGKVHSYNTSTLRLSTDTFDLSEYQICWTYLQELELDSAIAFAGVLQLISHAPALRCLKLTSVQIDSTRAVMLDSEAGNIGLTLPEALNRTIHTLYFNQNMWGSTDVMFKAIRYIILRVPTLDRIYTDRKIIPMVQDLFDSVLIPQGHFKSIKLQS